MESTEMPRRRGRPRRTPVMLGDLAALLSPEEPHETVIRRKAVALGLCDLTTAGALELAELEEMVKEAQAAGLDQPPPPPVGDAAGIVRELLEQLSVQSANGLPMTGMCKRCEMMPEHLKRDCVCRRARTWLETVHAGA